MNKYPNGMAVRIIMRLVAYQQSQARRRQTPGAAPAHGPQRAEDVRCTAR
jgi:hypothetical protein